MIEYNVGDVVTLNSGGPEMVVEGYQAKNQFGRADDVDKNAVLCVWFDKSLGKFDRSHFFSDTVSLVTERHMNNDGFKVGDTVSLNSVDSPNMTVYEIVEEKIYSQNQDGDLVPTGATKPGYQVRCIWWEASQSKYNRDIFPHQSLVQQEE